MKNLQFFIILITLLKIVLSTPKWYETSDGLRYLIETEAKYNWHQAMHECASKGGQIVSIETSQKNNALVQLLKTLDGYRTAFWIGGHDILSTSQDTKRPFWWSATGEKLSFTNWYPDNPNNERENEHCVHFIKETYQWNDYPCTGKMGYICDENYYVVKNKKDLHKRRTAVKEINTGISQDFDILQKQQIDEINKKIHNIELLEIDWKYQVQEILIKHQKSLQHITNENLFKVNQYYSELKNSTDTLNKRFSNNLTVKHNQDDLKLVY